MQFDGPDPKLPRAKSQGYQVGEASCIPVLDTNVEGSVLLDWSLVWSSMPNRMVSEELLVVFLIVSNPLILQTGDTMEATVQLSVGGRGSVKAYAGIGF